IIGLQWPCATKYMPCCINLHSGTMEDEHTAPHVQHRHHSPPSLRLSGSFSASGAAGSGSPSTPPPAYSFLRSQGSAAPTDNEKKGRETERDALLLPLSAAHDTTTAERFLI